MTPTQANGHKRARSPLDFELVVPETTATDQATRSSPRMVLMHLSALLSCEESITSVSRTLAAEVLPEDDLPKFTNETIVRAFTMSPMALDILGDIIGRDLTPEEARLAKESYSRIHHDVGGPLLGLAPRAKEFLELMKRHREDIKLAVISQNPPAAAAKLAAMGVGHLVDVIIPRIHIQVHSTDPATAVDFFWDHWQRMVAPSFITLCRGTPAATNIANGTTTPPSSETTAAATNKNDTTPVPTNTTAIPNTPTTTTPTTTNPNTTPAPLTPSQTLVVSCGLYDLSIAQPSGAQTCWVRRIRDEAAASAAARESTSVPHDMVVSGLDELGVELFGEGVGRRGEGLGEGELSEEGSVEESSVEEGSVEDGPVQEAMSVASSSEGAEVEVVKVVTVAATLEE
ncbi:uncharacterized protein B0H64DRAFT_443474 [Chaetomium fimeti]|uniref:Uncharacterized protein n=1 Tax=Chaetomium fimeti TaxID=1854472 RepID=A0AAE0HEW4_9PEZI|nr:hypothetical protein B0H64DRAFT_443474 [Chaetomium fimeti]